MAKELENNGIPTALIATLTSVATNVGAPRIIAGAGITHPAGNPRLSQEQERKFRQALVELALEALTTEVDGPRVFALGSEQESTRL
jgi:glycine reductase